MQTSFRSVMMSEHCGDPLPGGSSFSSFNNDYDERNIDADNVAILGGGTTPKDTHHEPMSAVRQCCFVGSIVLCVLAVFGFICLVPCREDGTCPAVIDRIKSHNWLNNYTRIELKGGVNIVAGPRSWENNLIFMYRGDRFFPEYKATKTQRHGIISLNGSSGAVAWFLEMIDEPLAIDCAQLDADMDGRPECLVIDDYGELAVLNPLSGQWVWRFMEHSVQRLQHVDLPVMLPDLDGDGVLEILSVGSINLQQRTKAYVAKGLVSPLAHQRNMLRIISGRSGHPIADDFQLHDCDAVRKLQLENQMVTFNCVRNNTELQRYKTLGDLVALITNKSLANQTLERRPPASGQPKRRPTAGAAAQRNTYSLSGGEMLVENRGHCPDACSLHFVLRKFEAGGKIKEVRNFTKAGMYGMVPAQWHFDRMKTSGFVVKFWKWHNVPPAADEGEVPFSTEKPVTATSEPPASASSSAATHNAANSSRGSGKMQKSNQVSKDNFTKPNGLGGGKTRKNSSSAASRYPPGTERNSFDHYLQKRHTFALLDPHLPPPPPPPPAPPNELNLAKKPLATPSAAAAAGPSHLINNYKMQMITETVILVLFVGGDTRIENTSQSNIVQFCRKERGEMLCQPDLRNQDNSLLVADLDQDDSQELVSYSSTFVEGPGGVSADEPDNWNLMTEVRLLRLESELAAFYADIGTN